MFFFPFFFPSIITTLLQSHVADVEAIKDAKRSLSSMLESFLTQRRQKGLVDIPRNAVAAAAQAMDMSHVSQAYEKEIRNPIYYFVAGDLVQMMLIQVCQLFVVHEKFKKVR